MGNASQVTCVVFDRTRLRDGRVVGAIRTRLSVTTGIAILSATKAAIMPEGFPVLPRRTTWRGPRTALEGLVGLTWPITIQSNKWRKAARRNFRGLRGARFLQLLDIGGDMHALDRREPRHAASREPVEEFDGGARIGAARVRIPDLRGEEFEEAIGGALTGRGDQRRGAIGEGDELIHAHISSS